MILKVEPSEEEEKIFRLLLDVVRHFRLGTTVRVAGGWVRDKKLGKQPTDIDIALDNISGQDFSARVDEYLQLTGKADQKGGTVVIRCNPDRSKHLETAKTSVFGREIDFVKLRSEEYAESSSMPAVKDGTPREDALRRDLTVNSLFFNINENHVEDFTERGVDDIRDGLIDTPLEAKDTLLDDPLRVLRAIRFAARFSFRLSDELREAALDEMVKLALARKISKERVGKEIDLMISGERPADAMSYVRELGLFYIAFAFPENCDPPVFDNCDWCCVSCIESAWNFAISVHRGVPRPMLLDDEQEKLYLYSALFFPLRKMFYLNEKSKKIAVTSYIIQESLRLPACVAKSVLKVHAASGKFAELVILFESNAASEAIREEVEDVYLDIPMDTWKRVYAGILLNEVKDLWRVALAISIIFYPEAENAGGTHSQQQQQDELHRRKEQYMRVERSITDLGLSEVWKLEPLVNGKIIMGIMHNSGSPSIGEWKKRVFKWQLAHPEGSMDDCIDWITRSQLKHQKVESSI